MSVIAVTGATGEVGGRVARLLEEQKIAARLVVRDPKRVKSGGEVVRADYTDPESMVRAFDGARAALIVSGHIEPMKRALLHKNAFEAAARSKVEHIVYTSFQSASPNSKFPYGVDHYQSEQHLAATGVKFSVLRDNLYADVLPYMFGRDGVLRAPASDGKTAWVSRDDVARCAVHLLINEPESSAKYVISGPEALTMDESAQVLSKLSGRDLKYETETETEAYKAREAFNAAEWEVGVWVGSYLAIAAGEMAQVSGDVEKLTGQPAESMADYFARRPELLGPLTGAG